MSYFLYILQCADNTLYTGTTNDVAKRVATHTSGKGAKYVRGRLPVKLIYTEEFTDKMHALSREWEVKQWPRSKKIRELKLLLK